jgi:hypothetical protein
MNNVQGERHLQRKAITFRREFHLLGRANLNLGFKLCGRYYPGLDLFVRGGTYQKFVQDAMQATLAPVHR